MSDKLDNFFKGRFENWEAPPPAGAWAAISAQVATSPAPPLWLWVGRVAASLWLAAMLFVFPAGKELPLPEGKLAGYIQESGKPDNNAQMAVTVPNSPTSSVSVLPSSAEQQALPLEKPTPESGHSSLLAEKKPIGKSSPVKPYFPEKHPSPTKTEQLAAIVPPTSFEVSGNADENEAPSEAKTSLFTKQDLAVSDLPFAPAVEVSVLDFAFSAPQIEGVSTEEKASQITPTAEKWNWGVQSKVFSSFVLIAPNANDETVIAKPTENEYTTDRIGWELGIVASKHFNQRWKMDIGAVYSSLRLSNSFSHHHVLPDSYELNTENGTISASTTMHESSAKVQYHMVGTELWFTHFWGNYRSLGVSFGAGLQYAYGTTYQLGDGARQYSTITEKNWLPSVALAFPVRQRQVHSKAIVEWAPFVRYNLGKLQHPTNLFQMTPYSVGLKATILSRR